MWKKTYYNQIKEFLDIPDVEWTSWFGDPSTLKDAKDLFLRHLFSFLERYEEAEWWRFWKKESIADIFIEYVNSKHFWLGKWFQNEALSKRFVNIIIKDFLTYLEFNDLRKSN